MKRPGRARFRVFGRFDGTSSATVTVDRSSGLVAVRPFRRRRAYDELPLSWAAEAIMWHVMKAEAAEKTAARKRRRR